MGVLNRDKIDWDRVRYFRKKEWGDDPEKVVPELVFLLDGIRARSGVAVVVHQAFARSDHSARSYHYQGLAVDFHFTGLSARHQFEILDGFEEPGAMGWYPHWNNPGWHIDLRENATRLYWHRTRDGRYAYGRASLLAVLGPEAAGGW